MSEPQGLYEKYVVTKRDENGLPQVLSGCFVLRPETDLLARHAIRVYAKAAGGSLGRDLNNWIDSLEDLHDTHK